MYLGIGLIAGRWGYQDGFLAAALVMILTGVAYLAFLDRKV